MAGNFPDPSLRGRCEELARAAAATDPDLRVVRGHYSCPFWGLQAHWWCVSPDGSIVDPTRNQFPSGGLGAYIEFSGRIACDQCGTEIDEAEALIDGNGRYAFCSTRCNARFVGVAVP